MGLTLVTCLFDIAGREGNSRRRTPAFYLEHGDFVFGLDEDIVFYVDSRFEHEVRSRRRAHGLLDRTTVRPVALESLPAHALLDQIRRARERHPLRNGNPDKDTPLYTVLMWSRFELLRRAMGEDAPAGTHFGWLDLGIDHVAETSHCREDGVFEHPTDGVGLLVMAPIAPDELADQGDYFSYLRGHVAAGYLVASRANLLRLCELFDSAALSALDGGHAGTDEQLLALLLATEPELFEPHHGDYPSILENFRRVRGSPQNLLMQMRRCRERADWRQGCTIGAGVVDACRADTLQCHGQLLSDLLDEVLIAAYHGRPDHALAHDAAALYAERARTDPDLRDAFLRNEIRIRTNRSYVS